MNSFRNKPPRYYQDNASYFLTFCTFRRRRLLHLPGIPEFLIEELHFYERKIRKLVAYTILPNHIHLIVEVAGSRSLSTFLQSFKSYTSKEIKKRLIDSSRRQPAVTNCDLGVTTSGMPTGSRLLPMDHVRQSMPTGSRLLHVDRVWQPGTMDHCIRMTWDGKDYENHVSYLFFNSQKHLGIAPKDFPYHNFIEFEAQGIFDMSFCSVNENICSRFSIYE